VSFNGISYAVANVIANVGVGYIYSYIIELCVGLRRYEQNNEQSVFGCFNDFGGFVVLSSVVVFFSLFANIVLSVQDI
jgi:hypothetical protein